MSSLTEFFNIQPSDNIKGIAHKNNIIKRNIIAYMAVNGESTLAELTKELHISVPTITKLVQELIDENIVNDLGKVETPGGRRPNVFGLANSAIYFVGVNVGRDNMTYVITDLQNNIIKEVVDTTFELQNRQQCLEKICNNIEEFISTCGIDRGKIAIFRIDDGLVHREVEECLAFFGTCLHFFYLRSDECNVRHDGVANQVHRHHLSGFFLLYMIGTSAKVGHQVEASSVHPRFERYTGRIVDGLRHTLLSAEHLKSIGRDIAFAFVNDFTASSVYHNLWQHLVLATVLGLENRSQGEYTVGRDFHIGRYGDVHTHENHLIVTDGNGLLVHLDFAASNALSQHGHKSHHPYD